MPIKDWQVGDRPTASDLNRYFLQQAHIIKPADESVTSSTVLQDDNHFMFSVQANTDYWVQSFLAYEAREAADFLFGWSYPSGADWIWVSDSLGSAHTGSPIGLISRTAQVASGNPAAGGSENPSGSGTIVRAVAAPKGLLRIGANAGTFRLRWAQLTSNATAVRLVAGSFITLRRLTT